MEQETLMTATPEPAAPQPTETPPVPPATEGQSSPVENTPQAPQPAEKPVEAAPEKYEFKAPKGQSFDEGVIGAFSEVAKELKLSQDSAQKVLDKMTPVFQARQQERFESIRATWAKETRADKELGGEKLQENLAVAQKAMDAFATPEFKTLLNESGFGNHPEVIRVFYRAGKAISEDRFVTGGAAGQPGDARRIYAASNMNP